MASPRNPEIALLLQSAYEEFHGFSHRTRDAIEPAHTFPEAKDKEAAAFVSALLSYGNVKTIQKSTRIVLSALGPSPYSGLTDGDFSEFLPRFRHRFTTGADLSAVLHWTGTALQSHGSLEAFFLEGLPAHRPPMKVMLSQFIRRLVAQPLPKNLEKQRLIRERSLKYLLSDPERGSACKRLNMFLRWMVRDEDGIDFGLWKTLKPSELILPIDTHLLKVLRGLRWTRSQQATWKVAEEATARLRVYDPIDPVRFDFALCHLSMSGENIRDFHTKVKKRGTDARME